MKNMKSSFWDILAWIAFGIVILYLLLKILGIISSPITLDIITLLSGAYYVGRLFQSVESTAEDVKAIKTEVKDIDKRLSAIEIKNGSKRRA